MTTQTQYTANLGLGTVSVANPYLDGSGTLALIASGASNGTFVKRCTIKATGDTTQGMVRLFVNNGNDFCLIQEVSVAAQKQTGIQPAFEATFMLAYNLASSHSIYVSTENNETFNIILDCVNFTSCTCV
jgi:hypothetical protein